LGAVTAVLTATPGFDAQKATQLNPFFFGPMLSMNSARAIQKGEKRLTIDWGELGKEFGGIFAKRSHPVKVAKSWGKVKN
jgi:hypothetical protein